MRFLCAVSLTFAIVGSASAHDTWVQINSPLVRVGDAVHVDLMLGNHGNEHRDFKIASKIDPAPCTLSVMAPSGKTYDVKPDLVDLGYAPKEGFWSARFVPGEEGVHAVVHTLDSVHRTTRGIKSSKSYFLASQSLDNPKKLDSLHDKPLGHPLEIVLLSHPSMYLAAGQPFEVQVLFEGEPLADAVVSCIPRGTDLAAGFDAQHERKTGADGKASFTPKEGTYHLVSVHHAAPDRQGDGYDATHFSANLALNVPQICVCCE